MRVAEPCAEVQVVPRDGKGKGGTAVVGEGYILEDRNEPNLPYLEPQTYWYENNARTHSIGRRE